MHYVANQPENLYRQLGAQLIAVEHGANTINATRFAVYAPNASSVSVIGDMNSWDGRVHPMQRTECGHWVLVLPEVAQGVRYKYEIKDQLGHLLPHKADPMAFYAEQYPSHASLVFDHQHYQWQDSDWCNREAVNPLHSPISIYELQTLKYWDLNTIYLVLPFVKVDDRLENMHITFKDAVKNGKIEWYLRYQRTPEQKKGYTDVSDSVLNNSNSYYRGNPDRYYTRFRYTYRTNISLGFTAEKDPGEEFFQGSQKNGFDYYSFHAFYKGGKYVRAVAAGDYQIQIGQGLNTWSGYAFGKSADIFSSKKSANLLRPYTSVDENRFFRGGAAILGYKKWNLLTFYSNKQVDGTGINDSLTDDLEFVTTIDLSGLHRTNSEISKKNRLTEQVIGNYLSYNSTRFNAGIAVVNQQYSQPLLRDTIPYNLYAFRGKNTTAISGDYNFVLRNFNFFGEVSYSTHSKAFAQLHGLMAVLDPSVSISVIYRNYSKNYYSFYNNGFSEGSNTQNESGLFSGIKVKLAPSWSVSSYIDFFRFPWLKYQVDAPSKGYEFLVQPTYRPNKVFELYARFRQQVRQKNSRYSDGTITGIEDVTPLPHNGCRPPKKRRV